MGVTGLWKLIEPSGKPVPVETLEGKILAVDISIWLHQVVKGFQDNKGAALNNAHLLGLFNRLCKLMYYRVKPVFVFDGCVPQLKRDTIARRQQQRSKLNCEADRIQALLLQSLAKEKIVQQALGPNAELLITSPVKKLMTNKINRKEDTVDDIFKLPDLPSTSKSNANENTDQTTDDSLNDSSFYSEDQTATGSTDDSSLDECNPRNAYNSNLQAIDVRSKEFLQLPADVRHEILVDIKETRKQSSWGRLHELPSRSDDFSNFQMKRLLKRRDVQVSLENAEQEMGGRTLTYAELTNIFNEEGILETDIVEKGTKQISSDEHTRFLLVKDLKKKLSQVKEEESVKEEKSGIKKETKENPSSTSDGGELASCSAIVKGKTDANDDKELGNEYDADLELAIALSLEEGNTVYDEKDYEFDSGESLKLTKAQRQQLQNTAKGPARSYMIEYAGMNKEEVVDILEKTQGNEDFESTLNIERLIGVTEEAEPRISAEIEPKQLVNNSESQDIRLYVTDESDSADSDLEEVEDVKETIAETANVSSTELKAPDAVNTANELKDNVDISDTDSELEEVKEHDLPESEKIKQLPTKLINKHTEIEDECVIEETPPFLTDTEVEKPNNHKTLNIQIDLSEPLKPEDDLFADIFEDKATQEEIIEETPTIVEAAEELKESKPLEIKTPPKTEEMLSILHQLKQEADAIKNIKLENIKLSQSVIEISDDETVVKANKAPNEIIEICDSDDNTKRPTTPTAQLSANQSLKQKTKSPKLKTPSKNHEITEFFDVNYVVKRTPDKPSNSNEANEEVAKVKSPFFVRKTPKSGRKSGSNSPSPNKKPTKANKSLFKQDDEDSGKNRTDKLDEEDGITPLIEPPNAEDVLKEAANLLKSQKTTEELSTIASDLAKERQELENERNRQDRMGMSITQRMNSDCQKLLRMFGVPYIVAPMEAEAQCAFLDIVQLTHGTITDDSDIWLFGGRTVYKNFFAQNKHVLEFRSEQIEKDFNCDRKKLIQLACLVGSDYTTGIHGIGAVTALEILASFAPKEASDRMEDPNSLQTILATLQRFRNWWLSFKSAAAPPGTSARLALQKKLKNIELNEGFPNTAVIEAYLTPKVDDNKEAFTWGYPDVESLREFAKKTFGWTTTKTDEILKPVLKKLNEKRTQQSIRNYFNVKSAVTLRQINVSKRVKNAIDKMTGNVDSDDASEKAPTKAKRARKSKKETVVSTTAADTNTGSNINLTSAPTSSNQQLARGPLTRAAKRVNIPEVKQVIPQREKDIAQMEANKKLAAEILKNTAKESKKKRKA